VTTALALLPWLLAQAVVEPPRTVNGIELGDADDFATPGPATVCMEQMTVTPRQGETAYLSYSGIHAGSIRLVLTDGDYVEFAHGDNWADQRPGGQRPAYVDDKVRIYRFEDGREVRYQVFAPSEWDQGRQRAVVLITGTGLSGNRFDERIFDRMSLTGGGDMHCDRRYGYGWDSILGDEPIETTEPE
jgi:hypothetical protein